MERIFVPRIRSQHYLHLSFRELILNILPKYSDGIGSAVSAVRHLLHVRSARVLHRSLFLWCWRRNLCELVLRNERHDILNVHAHLAYRLCYLNNVRIIHRGNVDRVHLYQNLSLHRLANSFQLILQQYFSRFYSRVPFAFIIDKRIDPLANLRVNGIKGDGYSPDTQLVNVINSIRQ